MFPIVDMHQDVAWSMLAHMRPFAASPSSFMLTESSWHRSNLKWVWCTIFAAPEYLNLKESQKFINAQFELYTSLLAHYTGWLVPVGSRESLSLMQEFGGQTGMSILVEGAEPIESPEHLEDYFTRGVRAMSLTWHHSNKYAGGNSGQGGLTDLGRRLVDEAARLGMAIDVSHLNKESYRDLFEYRKKHLPNLAVFASHANAYSVCPHERNLDDEQLTALREANGAIGLVLLNSYLSPGWVDTEYGDKIYLSPAEVLPHVNTPAFLAAQLIETTHPGPKLADVDSSAVPPEEVELEIVLEHIDHLKYMLGENRIGIGSDLDGGLTRFNTPRGINDLGDLQILGELIAEKCDKAFACKVMGENWIDFWNASLP